MKHLLHDFLNEESGQDLIEYGLIATLAALAAIAAVQGLGTTIANYYNDISNGISNVI